MIRRATIVAVGRLKGWAAEGAEDYAKRLRRHFPVEVIEVAEEDMNRRSADEVVSAEAGRLLKKLPDGAYTVALDRGRGRRLASEAVADRLESYGTAGRSHVAFLLGGPLGLSPEVLARADEAWSFGEITLPHALARVVLLEQVYRGVKIERGEKYHW
ncbi:23S rRNA (pseudouridine(1915)-N(3))-methyltransferase RlmH [Rubrobacter aplysinae]|uniref:23S rRNA (pseudouridine(1915)-N(3))-methyltransferase RlmH n=1 Tax=Rubrobacter aplysinae TaxID=909625 RepID=UPI00064BC03B|nr:23S rRNA (pseudouridine(1915)-N(3))-methyltransferase RlmH [Rubrobacter aplysinae]